jgi:hypothetical protein
MNKTKHEYIKDKYRVPLSAGLALCATSHNVVPNKSLLWPDVFGCLRQLSLSDIQNVTKEFVQVTYSFSLLIDVAAHAYALEFHIGFIALGRVYVVLGIPDRRRKVSPSVHQIVSQMVLVIRSACNGLTARCYHSRRACCMDQS